MPRFISDDEDIEFKTTNKANVVKRRKTKILDDSDNSNEQFPTAITVPNDTANSHCRKVIKSMDLSTSTHKITDNNYSKKKEYTENQPTTLKNYFMAMKREPPKNIGTRPIPMGKHDCLEGFTFVITGILELIERKDAINLIKRHGGKVTTAISGKTSYVVMGRDAGPAKIEKIKKFHIKTIDEEALFRMIEAHPIYKEESVSKVGIDIIQPIESKTMIDDHQTLDGGNCASIACTTNNNKSLSCSNVPKPMDSILWVDKYKPTLLKNLVGQHGPNSPANKLLRWLQNWNPLNYGRKKLSNASKDDGQSFKAALLSGKPGVGKTTSAILCCKELNLDYIELNASDTRNKLLLKNTIKESTRGGSFSSFFVNNHFDKNGEKMHVIIMDEVDGISGNKDRGGLIELVSTIKNTCVPIICICNERSNQKIRTLANYCYDLRFQRPRVEQIKSFCSTITFKEKLEIQPQALSEIIIGADQDIRQILNRLQMWSTTKSTLTFDQALVENRTSYKDSSQNVFDSVRKLLSSNEAHKMKINERMEQFFTDYSIMPLFIQENYLLCHPTLTKGGSSASGLMKYSEICDLLALSTVTDNIIRSSQTWSLLPVQGLLSCVIPSYIGSGIISGMINFPQWLGKNSTHGKNSRYLDQLSLHTRVSTYINRNNLITDFIPYSHCYIKGCLNDPSCTDDGSLDEVVMLMKQYNLTRDDWDLIGELGQYDEMNKNSPKIQTKILSAFTRALNKVKRILPYSVSNINKKNVKAVAEELLKLNIDEEGSEAELVSSDDASDEVSPIPNKESRKRNIDSNGNSNIKQGRKKKPVQ